MEREGKRTRKRRERETAGEPGRGRGGRELGSVGEKKERKREGAREVLRRKKKDEEGGLDGRGEGRERCHAEGNQRHKTKSPQEV